MKTRQLSKTVMKGYMNKNASIGTVGSPCPVSVFRVHLMAVVFLLVVACGEFSKQQNRNDASKPVNTVAAGTQSSGVQVNRAGSEPTSDNAQAKTSIQNFQFVITENKDAVTLSWDKVQHYNYQLVKAVNPDCDPIKSDNCKNYDSVYPQQPQYTDASIQSGYIYYYWLISRNTLDKDSASHLPAYEISEPLQVVMDFEERNSILVQTTDMVYLNEVTLTRLASNTVHMSWQDNPNVAIHVYRSNDSTCQVLQQENTCAQGIDITATQKSLQIPGGNLDDAYFWVHARIQNTVLVGNNLPESRLYGPFYSYYTKGTGQTSQSVEIHQSATFENHNLVVTIEQPHNLVANDATYNIYIISGDKQVSKEVLAKSVQQNVVQQTALQEQLNAQLYQFEHQQLRYDDMQLLANQKLRFIYKNVSPDTWYTVLVDAQENNYSVFYQPSAVKTMQRLRVQVQGKHGMWRIRDKVTDRLLYAKKESGFFYPTTVDWKTLLVDAQLEFPERKAYYFQGCAYYSDNRQSGAGNRLYNNECHYAKQDSDNATLTTVLSRPLPVKVVFERKAQANACAEYEELDSHGYRRSRSLQLDTFSPAICDYGVVSRHARGDKTKPNFYALVYPHGEPTEIARSRVEQWHAGTQMPVYLGDGATLSYRPDGIVTKSVCSDISDNWRCAFQTNVTVVRCNGYYVYQLAEPEGCSVGYAWEETPISKLHLAKEKTTQ